MDKLVLWLFFVTVAINFCNAYKLLVVFPFPAKSHSILGDNVVRHLLDAEHEVTYITPFPTKNPRKNLVQIDVSENFELFAGNIPNITLILNNKMVFNDPVKKFKLFTKLFENTITNVNVVKLLSDTNQRFDAVVAEWMFYDTYSGLSSLYECPFIWVSTIEPHSLILSLIDENTNPVYVPDIMSSNIPPYGFKQRVSELYTQLRTLAFKTFYADVACKEDFESFIGPYFTMRNKDIPSFYDVNGNISLILGNSHVSLGQATRLPQNYIPIAGYHIDSNVKPLPEDLKNLLDNSKSGLIYFSMGSNLKSKDLPDEIKRGLLKVFGELKQTVLWKFEEVVSDLPENVHIVQWAPQHGILAHPNCILFITHGGHLSTTETVHFGKPVIGIPVFADQFVNIERAVNKGFAIRVSLSYTMADDLKVAIKDVLNDNKYKERAKELSAIYHDRPTSPDKELVHWVQHVVRTGGAPHLRSPAFLVPVYQKYYLDLLALILAIIILLVISLKRILKSKKKENIKK
ncbi:UDP-glucosyltransferase 2-like, partial [Achroia grisella]|uniref:UDP-glucosyltransferase 2-like n=1 Tax=Achroia grisella TaxID=688607 RepID=UPI0027D209E5